MASAPFPGCLTQVLRDKPESQSLTLSKWEPYVQVEKLYLPLVLTALSTCHGNRLYLALDTTILWDRYCMIRLSVCCCVLIQADVHPTPIAKQYSITNLLRTFRTNHG